MAFSVSPAVTITEKDASTTVAGVATSIGAYAGKFRWGPAYSRFLVSDESDLLARVARPDNNTAVDFFTATSFLSYAGALRIVRVVDMATAKNSGDASAVLYTNDDAYQSALDNETVTGNKFIGRFPGSLGDSIRVSTAIGDYSFALSGTFDVATGSRLLLGTTSDVSGELVVGDKVIIGANTFVVSTVGNAKSIALTSIAGTFTTGETVSDGTHTATVVWFDSSNSLLYVSGATGTLTGSTTGGTSSATATAGTNTAIAQSVTVSTSYLGATVSDGSLTGIKTSSAYRTTLTGTVTFTAGSTTVTGNGTAFTTQVNANDWLTYLGRRYQVLSITNDTTLTLVRKFNNTTATGVTAGRDWEFAQAFNSAPGVDEIHVMVVDEDGEISGSSGSVLEPFEALSLIPGTKSEDGTLTYFVDALNRRSKWIRWGGDDLGTIAKADNVSLTGGVDSYDTIGNDERIQGYDLFNDADAVDVGLLIAGEADGVLGSYLIQDIAEVRRDAVAFISPPMAAVVNNFGNEVADSVVFRNELPSSSYGFLDSGWKYMYDKYNDTYRWIPLNGDMAGLCALTEYNLDAWWSFAGFNRGNVKNVVKLAYNPTKAQRDDLYSVGINPVVDFPGDGTILYGDKTLLNKPSAFNRINVRRLFIVLEKSIANSAKFTLFEFNDVFTRANFVATVEPFLRTVMSRRGVTDFKVVCDTSNNTADVINTNGFVGDIYVRPNYSTNYINLNFVAVRNGVDFTEIVGI